MKKLIITVFAATIAVASFAQKVRTADGHLIDVPYFSDNIQLAQKRMPATMSSNIRRRIVSGTDSGLKYVKHSGTVRIPVILVNYKDTSITASHAKAAFNALFNHKNDEIWDNSIIGNNGNGVERNFGSVAQYYLDNSNGTFNTVFDIYGPVTVNQTRAYYGKNETSALHNQLVVEAASKLQNTVDTTINFSQYDNDGNGTIDCVYIVYAGNGENFGFDDDTDAVWANTNKTSAVLGGMDVDWYTMSGEYAPIRWTSDKYMITGIGVIVHELTHAMGLPDVYPTTEKAQQVNNQDMEYWDLMDGGEYVFNGFCPVPYTAWEKSQMEWPVDIQRLETSGSYTIKPSVEGGTVYKLQNPADENEYILFENVKKSSWASHLPMAGLLAYHVKDSGKAINLKGNYNNVAGTPRMALIPADSVCLSNYIDANNERITVNGNSTTRYRESMRHDLFPNSGYTAILSDSLSLPNFYWYTAPASDSIKATANSSFFKIDDQLRNITLPDEDGNIQFNFVASVATGIRNISNAYLPNVEAIYTITGKYVGTDATVLPKGIYIRNHKKFNVK